MMRLEVVMQAVMRLVEKLPLLSNLLAEDVKLMVEKGFEAYRFSISWSRLIRNVFSFFLYSQMVEYPSTPRDCKSITISSMNSLAMNSTTWNTHYFDLPEENEYGRWVSVKIMSNNSAVCFLKQIGENTYTNNVHLISQPCLGVSSNFVELNSAKYVRLLTIWLELRSRTFCNQVIGLAELRLAELRLQDIDYAEILWAQ